MNIALKPAAALVLGLVVAAAGAYLALVKLETGTTTASTAGATQNKPREVDFGLAELDHGGVAVRIPSYKNGGTMVLYAGEELEYQAMGDGPIPPLELRVGQTAQQLAGPSGRITITAPAGQPMPVVLHALGSRVSLPGGAPPRISVKIQVYGPPRPTS